VRTGQRESGEGCVVKRGWIPCRSCVARVASRGKSGGDVVWIRRACKVLLVASIAKRRERRVVSVDMARRARHANVCAGQREGRLAVIKCCRRPCRRIVAGVASGRNSSSLVIGIRGGVVIRHVARGAVHRDGAVVPVYVA